MIWSTIFSFEKSKHSTLSSPTLPFVTLLSFFCFSLFFKKYTCLVRFQWQHICFYLTRTSGINCLPVVSISYLAHAHTHTVYSSTLGWLFVYLKYKKCNCYRRFNKSIFIQDVFVFLFINTKLSNLLAVTINK